MVYYILINSGDYKIGLNETKTFYSIVEENNIGFLLYVSYDSEFIVKVVLPEDANVQHGHPFIHTNKMILLDKIKVSEFIKDLKNRMLIVSSHGGGLYLLPRLEEQAEELCLEAVKYDGNALQCIKKQTSDMCSIAIMQNSTSKQYIKTHT